MPRNRLPPPLAGFEQAAGLLWSLVQSTYAIFDSSGVTCLKSEDVFVASLSTCCTWCSLRTLPTSKQHQAWHTVLMLWKWWCSDWAPVLDSHCLPWDQGCAFSILLSIPSVALGSHPPFGIRLPLSPSCRLVDLYMYPKGKSDSWFFLSGDGTHSALCMLGTSSTWPLSYSTLFPSTSFQ